MTVLIDAPIEANFNMKIEFKIKLIIAPVVTEIVNSSLFQEVT